jgi:hypothetical protein
VFARITPHKHLDHYEEMTGVPSPVETFEVALDRLPSR